MKQPVFLSIFIFIFISVFIALLSISTAQVPSNIPTKKEKALVPTAKQVVPSKGYGYISKERANFETLMFHLKNLVRRKEKENALFLLKHRIEYLENSLPKVFRDEEFTDKEKKIIEKLNHVEIKWLRDNIQKLEEGNDEKEN